VALVIGGMDDEGGHVYSLDAAGGAIEDKYVTTGSGSPYVYGVLEDHYKDGLSTSDALDIAIRALSAAMKRDAASGDGIDLAVINKKEFKQLTDDEIAERKKKLGIQ
jgi:proteasome beta subunit